MKTEKYSTANGDFTINVDGQDGQFVVTSIETDNEDTKNTLKEILKSQTFDDEKAAIAGAKAEIDKLDSGDAEVDGDDTEDTAEESSFDRLFNKILLENKLTKSWKLFVEDTDEEDDDLEECDDAEEDEDEEDDDVEECDDAEEDEDDDVEECDDAEEDEDEEDDDVEECDDTEEDEDEEDDDVEECDDAEEDEDEEDVTEEDFSWGTAAKVGLGLAGAGALATCVTFENKKNNKKHYITESKKVKTSKKQKKVTSKRK